MPFIDQLQRWARTAGQNAAVVVGEHRLTFAQLLAAATSTPGAAQLVEVIDEPTSTALAARFCAAVYSGKVAMVIDAQGSPDLRHRLRDAALDWANGADHGGSAEPPFLLGLSSGTSGLPKAFTRSSASWQESMGRSVEFFEVTERTVTLAPGPLAASMNLYALGESIYAGSTFVALPHFSTAAALAAMAEHNVNRLVLVPTVLELLAGAGLRTQQSGQQLASIVCAGSALSAGALALAREWAPNAAIHQYYGAAELGFVAASGVDRTGTPAMPETSVGTAFPGVQISIRDGHGKRVDRGVEGTIYVKSPYVCSGYAWGDDGLAFSSLAANAPWRQDGQDRVESELEVESDAREWFTVHDQGRLDNAGRLHVLGRASDMIVTAGANVYPHAVEAALAAAAAASFDGRHVSVLVTGREDPLRGQRLVAGLYASEGIAAGAGERNATALLARCRLAAAKLPASHRPSQYYLLDALPLTGSGKISRAIFTQWLNEGDPRAQRLH
ncbi:AMP-binding protein [Arthrobacter glacialis]|uniref:AMP-dependent synthetase n=1 Tax=Arthrobacter glacialis TaxID=1664 RepID=A0A2S3ZWS2_ARTGL|nr:AMP-binding protein [Arthrobacter glacialis]POH73382.1 AMP-dependent synthetase [Arthrobacter glacialis]